MKPTGSIFATMILTTVWIFFSPHLSVGENMDQHAIWGESLYRFKYLGVTVAQGSISLRDTTDDRGRSIRLFDVGASSSSSTSILFQIQNRYQTTIDAETGTPLMYEKSIVQSNFREDRCLRFDQTGGTLSEGGTPSVSFTPPLHTFFSALNIIVTHRFRPRETFTLPVYAAGGIREVAVEAVRTEKISTPAGTFSTVLVEIMFQSGEEGQPLPEKTDVLTNRLVGSRDKTRLWVSTGQWPLLVKGEFELYPTALQMILIENRIEK